jgi:VCBS repeat-containing protein
VTGTWADSDAEATSKGIHAGHTTSTDTATPGKVVATALMNAVVIHYLKQVDGGTFRYRIDSGSWTSVDTSNAGDLYATETVSGLDGSSHTLTIEVTVAGSAGVTLMGIEPQLTADGVRTHFGGNGGTQALHFSQLNATLFQDGITALDPDLVIIILGTNDCVNDVTIANFETRYNTVIDRIQAAVPLADIVLVCPAADYLEGTYPMSDYQASIRSMAVSQGCACLDLYMDFGPYNDAVTRGIMVTADVHPTDAGYRLIVNLLLNRLLNMGE